MKTGGIAHGKLNSVQLTQQEKQANPIQFHPMCPYLVFFAYALQIVICDL